jgi:hypothetical protein
MHILCSISNRPNLELKTRPRQLLAPLPLDVVLPNYADILKMRLYWQKAADIFVVSGNLKR